MKRTGDLCMKALERHARDGGTYADAARAVGLRPQQFARWRSYQNRLGKPKRPQSGPVPRVEDPAVVAAIIDAASNHDLKMPHIAALGGISDRSLREWLQHGKAGDPVYEPFFRQWMVARAKAASACMVELGKAGPGEWQKHAWKLERLWGWTVAAAAGEEVAERERDPTTNMAMLRNALGRLLPAQVAGLEDE